MFIVIAIKNVLKNEDLNPETQEKLLQLQKYQEQKLRDPVSQTSESSTKKRPLDTDDLPTESEPPRKVAEQVDSGYFIFSYIMIIVLNNLLSLFLYLILVNIFIVKYYTNVILV